MSDPTNPFAPLDNAGWMYDPATCLCVACSALRLSRQCVTTGLPLLPVLDFRYACEICGNKRCPHHRDHDETCTGSNEPGQSELFAGTQRPGWPENGNETNKFTEAGEAECPAMTE